MIKEIKAEKVFPVHTTRPDLFEESGEKIELVKKGEKKEV